MAVKCAKFQKTQRRTVPSARVMVWPLKLILPLFVRARDRAVAGERPRAAGPDGHDRVVRDHRAPFGVIDDVDRAGEAAAVLERQVQRLDRVDEDIAFQRLRVGGELDLRAVAAGCAPAVRRGIADHAQQIPVGILIFERHARERQDAVRVRDVEQIAVLPISEPPVIENSDVPTSASPDMDW